MFDVLFAPEVIWFTVAGLVGTVFFALRIGISLIVGDLLDTDAGDADGGMDFDASAEVDAAPTALETLDADLDQAAHADSTSVFKLLSIQAITAFLMGFGWGGLMGVRTFDLSALQALGVGVLVGAGFVWLITWLLSVIYQLQSSGNVSIREAVGRQAQVYVAVPAGKRGAGQIRVVLRDRQRVYTARTEGDAIARGTTVRVTGVAPDNTLVVESV